MSTMRTRLPSGVVSLAVFVVLLSTAAVVHAERFSVNVSRLDKDLYRDNTSKTIIETRYCYQYATREDAVLTWEGRYGTNSLIFVNSGTKCDVVALR